VDPVRGGAGAKVRLFGVIHDEYRSDIAEFVMTHRVPAVVVESAVTPLHGSATGNRITCADYDPGPGGFYLRMFCGSSAQLERETAPLQSSTWKQLAAHLNGEFLVYVAAFFTKADLIFGDVPKEETFRQLDRSTTALDLDREFGIRAAAGYLDLLRDGYILSKDLRLDSGHVVPQILFLEREAAMAEQLAMAAAAAPPGAVVVGVVGAEHVLRIRSMLETGDYARILQRKRDRPTDGAGEAAAPGVKRALLTAVMAMVGESARQAMEATLGPVPPEHEAEYRATREVYGSVRMLLAALDPDLLDQVCCGLDGRAFDHFAAFRAVRPLNGGAGYSDATLGAVRTDRSP